MGALVGATGPLRSTLLDSREVALVLPLPPLPHDFHLQRTTRSTVATHSQMPSPPQKALLSDTNPATSHCVLWAWRRHMHPHQDHPSLRPTISQPSFPCSDGIKWDLRRADQQVIQLETQVPISSLPVSTGHFPEASPTLALG